VDLPNRANAGNIAVSGFMLSARWIYPACDHFSCAGSGSSQRMFNTLDLLALRLYADDFELPGRVNAIECDRRK